MKFRHHLYKWSRPFESIQHHWELVGPDGGIHFSVSMYKEYDPSCGLEFHHTSRARPAHLLNEAPHHRECPVLGEPCWHDGTSLYARERIWPIVEPMLRCGDHDAIFRLLEREYTHHFSQFHGNVEAA